MVNYTLKHVPISLNLWQLRHPWKYLLNLIHVNKCSRHSNYLLTIEFMSEHDWNASMIFVGDVAYDQFGYFEIICVQCVSLRYLMTSVQFLFHSFSIHLALWLQEEWPWVVWHEDESLEQTKYFVIVRFSWVIFGCQNFIEMCRSNGHVVTSVAWNPKDS